MKQLLLALTFSLSLLAGHNESLERFFGYLNFINDKTSTAMFSTCNVLLGPQNLAYMSACNVASNSSIEDFSCCNFSDSQQNYFSCVNLGGKLGKDTASCFNCALRKRDAKLSFFNCNLNPHQFKCSALYNCQ
jgi:hypothetical protein